ncbi:MAG: hypothetical protein ACK5MW_09090 [Enterococcus sp.]
MIVAKQTSHLDSLNEIPAKTIGTRILEYLVPGIIILLIGYSFVQGYQEGLSQLIRWWLWNGGVAVLFTLFTFANPITILVTFVFAPLGTLLPFVSVGVFSALTEAWFNKPTVQDFMTMDEDIRSVKGVYKNKVLKIGLIFILASLGAAIGNLIAGLDIFRTLF